MSARRDVRTCAKCGAELAGVALGNLCPACVAPLAFGMASLHAPALHTLPTFDGYELLEEIGRGGMGVVFKARQTRLNRIVAVKTILAGPLAGPVELRRLRAEAEAAAGLQHPNIVAIHEVGERDGLPYFSMEYVEGQTLAQLVRTGPLPARRAAAYLKALSKAVHYAHQAGILHRDLKPANVLIDRLDQPRITDFGLAKRIAIESETGAAAQSQLTITGQVLGTPNFMAPEQAAAIPGGPGLPADVYSLGAILYFLLTGQPPFSGRTPAETLAAVLHSPPVPPRGLNRDVPRDLETICLKCLEKEPRRRYASAQELAEDLGRFLADEPILARPVGRVQRTWRWCRRYPAVSSLTLSLVITVATFSLVLGILGARQSRLARMAGSRPLMRRSYQYAGSVPTLLAFDEDTLKSNSFGLGLSVAVDPRNNHLWCPIMRSNMVVIRDGGNGRVLTNLVLADCPCGVAFDTNHRIAWVAAQCGMGNTNFYSSDMLWAIDADTYEIIRPILCGGVNGSPEVVNPLTGRYYHGCNPRPRADSSCQRVDTTTFLPTAWPLGSVRAIHPVAGLLYAGTTSNTLQILDGLPDPEKVLTNLTLPFAAGPSAVAVDPVLDRICIGASDSTSIVVANAHTGQLLETIVLDEAVGKLEGVWGLAIDSKRNRLFAIAGRPRDKLYYLFAITGHIQRAIRLPDEAGGPVVNPALNKVYVWVGPAHEL
jgi:serine/threonine protein kinase